MVATACCCVFALVLPVCLCSIYLSMVFHVLSRQHGHCRLPQAPAEWPTPVPAGRGHTQILWYTARPQETPTVFAGAVHSSERIAGDGGGSEESRSSVEP